MSTLESLSPGGAPTKTSGQKRRRFAGERLGAWVFAASFSIGIWGLALKILSPPHVEPAGTSAPRHAVLTPNMDGTAKVVWVTDGADPSYGLPITDAVPVMILGSPTVPEPDHG